MRSICRSFAAIVPGVEPSGAMRVAKALVPQVVALVALGGASIEPAIAQDDPGLFAVRSGSVQLKSGVYFLNAWIEYRLPSDAREALQSGVPLTIRIDVELLHNRRLWFDNEEHSLEQRYQLEYHALSERYIVRNLNSGDQSSFSTLFAALNSLGRIEALPLIDAALLDEQRDYVLRLRAVLDMERLTGPLRLLAFWRRDWSIASEWHRWPLVDK